MPYNISRYGLTYNDYMLEETTCKSHLHFWYSVDWSIKWSICMLNDRALHIGKDDFLIFIKNDLDVNNIKYTEMRLRCIKN